MVGGPTGLSYYSFRDLGDVLQDYCFRDLGDVLQDYSFRDLGGCPTGLLFLCFWGMSYRIIYLGMSSLNRGLWKGAGMSYRIIVSEIWGRGGGGDLYFWRMGVKNTKL